MLYQRKIFATGDNVGDPAPLPADLLGLDDATLGNLSAHLDPDACAALGYAGAGFYPVADPAPPAPVRSVSQIEFMQRIPAGKRIAIRVASKTDPIVEDFLDMLAKSIHGIELDNADTVAGLGYCQTQNLLTGGDVAVILA